MIDVFLEEIEGLKRKRGEPLIVNKAYAQGAELVCNWKRPSSSSLIMLNN